jgi:uncharacterized GH25 family protein
MIVRRFVLAAASSSLLCAAAAAHAHEFIVTPSAASVKAGAPLTVSVISSHVFMKGEELEKTEDVRVGVLTPADGKREKVAVRPDEKNLIHAGTVSAPTDGTFLVIGKRAGQIWANTPEGDKQVPKKAPGMTNARLIEKFDKTLVNLSPSDDGYKTLIGDRLEIVPLTNPATVKVGDEIAVRVVFDKQPLTAPVFATYDGFSTEENTYAYYTEGRDDGTAKVKITHPGLWMVRVEHKTPEKTETHDTYVARAVLVFAVKG